MQKDVALPQMYFTKNNCDIPVGHIRLSCHFVQKEDFDATNFWQILSNKITATSASYTLGIDVIQENTAAAGVTVDSVVLKDGGVSASSIRIFKKDVTQSTNITTTVAVPSNNGHCVVLTTQSATAAAGVVQRFTVTNSAVGATDVVLATIINYAGTTGNPTVSLDAIGTGTFDVVITNIAPVDPLNGALKIVLLVV
jgi:hypothetical protein